MSDDRLLKGFLINHKLISPEQLAEAMEARKKLLETGAGVSLEDVLLQKGYINTHQVTMIHAAIGRSRTDLLPGYEILGKIGQGGMGAVYKARQLSMDRLVAIKIMLPNFAKEKDAVDRFLREARVLAKLSHPNIVRGIDAGHHNGVYYYAMEFVEGMSLASILAETGRLPADKAMAITRQVAAALDHAHHHGIVHRDIKPDNILMDRSGVAKLTDLGLAKFEVPQADASLTQTGLIVGSPTYMSPEQALGQKDLDTRTDIYSLGLTLYEMLVGKRAYPEESPMMVLARKVNEELPVDALRHAGIEEGIVSLIRKMCAKKREQRQQSPSELLADLGRLTQPPPQRSSAKTTRLRLTTVTARVPRVPQSSSNPVLAVLIGAILVAGIFFFIVASRPSRPVATARPKTPEPVEPAEPPPIVRDATPTPAPAPKPKVEPPPDPKPAPIPKADPWEEALEYEKIAPGPEDALLSFRQVRERLKDPAECDKKIAEYQKIVDDAMGRWRQELKAELDALLEKLRFGSARRAVDVSRHRFRDSAWTLFVREQEKRVEELLAGHVKEAREGRDKAHWIRIKTFEIPELSLEADEKIAAIDKAAAELKKVLESERKTLADAWARAVSLARSRKYRDALSILQSLALKHEFTQLDAKEYIRALGLAWTVMQDANEHKLLEENMPAVDILRRYASARKTTASEDQPFARFMFAVLENEADEADKEIRSPGSLRPEYQALLKEARDAEKARNDRRISANAQYRRALNDVKVPSSRDKALETFRTLQDSYKDVLKKDQLETISSILASPPPGLPDKKEIVVWAEDAVVIKGKWKLQDTNNASAQRRGLTMPENEKEQRDVNVGSQDYFEWAIDVVAEEYSIWLHMHGKEQESNSIHVQVEDSEHAPGSDDAFKAQVRPDKENFHWTQGNDWGNETIKVKFKSPGRKKIRIYHREGGVWIDQIVISAVKYKDRPPDQDKLTR